MVSVVVVSAISVLGTACGGSGSGSSTGGHRKHPSSAVTKKTFLAKANSICKRMNEESRAAPVPGPHTNRLDLADMVQTQADIAQRALTELRQLTLPAHDGNEIRAIFSEVNTAITDMTDLAYVLRAGDDKAAFHQALAKEEAQAERVNKMSRAYGMTVCAED
jgi:hypothetical protein